MFFFSFYKMKKRSTKRSTKMNKPLKFTPLTTVYRTRSLKSTPLTTVYRTKTPEGYKRMSSSIRKFKYDSNIKYNQGQFKKSLSSNLINFSFSGRFVPK